MNIFPNTPKSAVNRMLPLLASHSNMVVKSPNSQDNQIPRPRPVHLEERDHQNQRANGTDTPNHNGKNVVWIHVFVL